MTDRSIKSITGAAPQPGSGILHPFPTRELPHIDPFVFLDTGAPRNLGAGDIYVGPHSHRGVQPVSLLFSGRIEHRDSLGNDRTVTTGGMQWLVAGSGALHEEVLNGDENGVFHMAQLWINVPAALKMDSPEHHAVPAEHIPELTSLGRRSTLRLYAGDLDGKTGPAPMPTPVLVAHATLEADGSATIPVPPGWTSAFTVVAGAVGADGRHLIEGDTPVFNDDGASVTITSEAGGQVLLMCGEPIGEPIAMGGGFVMNTSEEIEAAFNDERSGRLGRLEPSR
ncbi:MAG: pirin family protein [Acidimicrobiales bacterium]